MSSDSSSRIRAREKGESPQRRYASLHRALERGDQRDVVWAELVHVCVEIGNKDEAIKALENVHDVTRRERLCDFLRSNGLLSGSSQDSTKEERGLPAEVQTGFRDEIADSVRFLFEDHMPLTVMVATLTFPLVIGLGGFLTAGSNQWIFPAIAVIPVLAVVGLVGALARRVLLDALRGENMPPKIPETGALAREAMRFLVDGAALSLLLLGPGIGCLFIPQVPTGAALAALSLGALLLPMAMVLRQTRNDWQSIAPRLLLPSVARGGVQYMAAVAISCLLFLPAVLAGSLTMGSELYLQLSFIGPLLVAPLFIASRLMGRVLMLRRQYLEDLLLLTKQPEPEPEEEAVTMAEARERQQREKEEVRAKVVAAKMESRRVAAAQRELPDRAQPLKSQPARLAGRPTATQQATPGHRQDPSVVARRKPAARPKAAQPKTAPKAEPTKAAAKPAEGRQVAPKTTAAKPPVKGAPARKPQSKRPQARPAATAPHATASQQAGAQQARPIDGGKPPVRRRPRPQPAANNLGAESHPEAKPKPQPTPKRQKAVQQTLKQALERSVQEPTHEPQPVKAAAHSHVVGDDIPDLTNMPGFRVLKGQDRVEAGAAATTLKKRSIRPDQD